MLLRDTETNGKYVRKELRGDYPVYLQLHSLAHPYLLKLAEVSQEDGQTVILEEYIAGPLPGTPRGNIWNFNGDATIL